MRSPSRVARRLAQWWKSTANRPRRGGRSLTLESLEDRTVFAYGFGSALAFGTPGNDIALAAAADPAGNVAVVGNFASGTMDLDSGPGSYSLTNSSPSGNGFAASYHPDGTLRWGAHFSSSTGNGAFEVVADAQGNVFVAGSVGQLGQAMQILPHAGTPITLTSNGQDHFLAKFSAGGNLLWARTLGEGGANRVAYDLATDAHGNVYATGSLYNGTAWIHEAFVAKYEGLTGGTVWSRLIQGGTGQASPYGYTTYASGNSLAVDAAGNVWSTGTYLGTIDFNPDATQANWLTYSGAATNSIDGDVYLLKLDAAGDFLFAGSVGSPDYESAGSIAVDEAGNAYLQGFSRGSQVDLDPGAGTLALPGGGFVLKTDPSGNLAWARSGVAGTQAMRVDAGGVYLIGSFTGQIDADPGAGTFPLTSQGNNDVVISQLDGSGNFVWAASIGGPLLDLGRALALGADGSLYATGSFRATVDFDPGAGAYHLTSTTDSNQGNSTSDVFLLKLVPTNGGSTPSLSINDVMVTEGHAGTATALFTVTLSEATAQPVTVEFATASGTATAGSDFTSLSGTLTFAAGEITKTIAVPIQGDRIGEPDETFLVNLSSPVGATLADGQGVGAIMDDEPRVSISDVTKAEGKKGAKTQFTFTISLSAAYDQPVTMSFKTVNGTATTGNKDYVAQNGTLTFAPGETTKTITIEVKGDSKRESDEAFYLDLFGLSGNALFTKNRGIGTILNDD